MADPKPRVQKITHELISVMPLYEDAEGNNIPPPGLTLVPDPADSDQMRVNGRPDAPGPHQVIYRTSDVYGRSRELEINLEYTIEAVTLSQPAIRVDFNDGQNWVNTPRSRTVVLAEAVGNPEIAYSITSDLPDWLKFDPDTRTLTIFETLTTVSATITYQACDSLNQTAEVRVNVQSVTGPMVVGDIAVDAGVKSFYELPTVIGDGLTHAVSALPSWITYEEETRRLIFSPPSGGTLDVPSITYTISRGANSKSDTFRVLRRIEVDVPNLMFDVSNTISTRMPEATQGHPPFTYAMTGLPEDYLRFNSDTRILSGHFTVEGLGNYNVSYVVTDSAGQTFRASLVISSALTRPEFMFPELKNHAFDFGDTIDVELPEVGVDPRAPQPPQIGYPPYQYQVAGLFGDLSFNPENRKITGTASIDHPGDHTIEYFITDSLNRRFRDTFILAVNTDLAYSAVSDQSLTLPSSLDITLPQPTGGKSPYEVAVENLTSEMMYDNATRRLSGTITKEGVTNILVEATDAHNHRVEERFLLSFAQPLVLPTIQDQRFATYNFSVQLPEASGGRGNISYKLEGLVTGMTFDQNSRVLSVSVSDNVVVNLTYSATDEDERTTSQTFNLVSDIRVAVFVSYIRTEEIPDLAPATRNYRFTVTSVLGTVVDTPTNARFALRDNGTGGRLFFRTDTGNARVLDENIMKVTVLAPDGTSAELARPISGERGRYSIEVSNLDTVVNAFVKKHAVQGGTLILFVE